MASQILSHDSDIHRNFPVITRYSVQLSVLTTSISKTTSFNQCQSLGIHLVHFLLKLGACYVLTLLCKGASHYCPGWGGQGISPKPILWPFKNTWNFILETSLWLATSNPQGDRCFLPQARWPAWPWSKKAKPLKFICLESCSVKVLLFFRLKLLHQNISFRSFFFQRLDKAAPFMVLEKLLTSGL